MSTKDAPTTKGQAALAMREISTSVSALDKVTSAPSVHLNISSQTMASTQAFRNGRIFTAAAGSDELVDLLVISDGLVEYAGPSSSYTAVTERSKEEVDELLVNSRDLEQAVVLPGFIDSHTHLEMMGDFIGRLNLLHCEDLADLKRALVDYRNANPGLKRLLGRSWMWEIFARGDQPTRQVIDDVIPDIPVYLDANDLHSCWLNSKALEELGIDGTVTNPKGGEFARDGEGHLTGFLSETAVTEYVWPYLARQTTPSKRVDIMQAALEAYLATGVTGAIEMACTTEHLDALEELYKRSEGSLPVRVWAHVLISGQGTAKDHLKRVVEAAKLRDKYKSFAPDLNVVGIKIISDGVIDACTAYMKSPYADGKNCNPIWSRSDLEPVVVASDKAGLQVAIHAIGDAASEMAMDVFEAAAVANGPDPTRRHRIEHLESVTKESIARMAAAGVIASLQPVHADPVLAFNWMAMLGHDDRCNRAFPWTEFVDAGVDIALGTDAPTAPYDALPNMYIASTRRSALKPDMPWPPTGPAAKHIVDNQRFKLPMAKAIVGATRGAAFSCRAENMTGSLQPGMAADFCILSVDPFKDGTATLAKAQEGVKETWVAGKQLYVRKS